MSMTAEKLDTINACFGTYPQTQALKSGQIKSDRVDLRLTEVKPVYKAFGMMVRDLKFDISEMAIVTYLQAQGLRQAADAVARHHDGPLSARHHALQFRARHGDAADAGRQAHRRALVRADHRRAGCAAFCGRITASTTARSNG